MKIYPSDNEREVFHAFFEGQRVFVDTQGFMVKTANNSLVLAFRETESIEADWRDWLGTDLRMWKSLVVSWANYPLLRVHKGFLRAYNAVRNMVIEEVASINPRHIYTTGHSLGAALATLAALDLQRKYPAIPVTMYNFGSPRVGNAEFALHYRRKVRDSHRVVHDMDRFSVFAPPPLRPLGYTHVKLRHRLPRDPLSEDSWHRHDMIFYQRQLSKE